MACTAKNNGGHINDHVCINILNISTARLNHANNLYRYAELCGGKPMALISFSVILTAVILNAKAQILMKTGTIAIGHFDFTPKKIVLIG
jgi:hypothetical protein